MRYFIYIKNDQKRMFEQIGGVFPSIGAATKYKKQNNLSGVIISRKELEAFNHHHRNKLEQPVNKEIESLMEEMREQIEYTKKSLKNMEKIYEKMKKIIEK